MKKVLSLLCVAVLVCLVISGCSKPPAKEIARADTPLIIECLSGEMKGSKSTGKTTSRSLYISVRNISKNATVSMVSFGIEAFDSNGEVVKYEDGETVHISEHQITILPGESKKIEEVSIKGFPNSMSFNIWLDTTVNDNGEYWQNLKKENVKDIDFDYKKMKSTTTTEQED